MPSGARNITFVLAGAALAVAAPAGRAAYVAVGTPKAGEPTHAAIFEAYYTPGVAWIGSDLRTGQMVDYTNGSWTALRVEDSGLGGLVDPLAVALTFDDQVWRGAKFIVNAVAAFEKKPKFGYDLLNDALGPQTLFKVRGKKFNVAGSATLLLMPGDSLGWTLQSKNSLWSTQASANPGGLDRVVTYRIFGPNDNIARWMLFFEGKDADWDYNDLVVEVTAVPDVHTVLLLLLTAPLALLPARKRT